MYKEKLPLYQQSEFKRIYVAVPLSAGAFSHLPLQEKRAGAAITYVTLFFCIFHYFIVYFIYSLFMFFFCVSYSLFCCAADQPSSSTWRALSSDSAHTQFQMPIVKILVLFICSIFLIINNLNWT